MTAAGEAEVDVRRSFLPTRAIMLSYRELVIPTRRCSLQATHDGARQALRTVGDPDRHNMAALGAAWETVSALELAANIAAPWVDPQLQSEYGAWIQMTQWDGGQATRFYESSHKWTVERYGVLAGHYLQHGDEQSVLDLLQEAGDIPAAVVDAWDEAQRATAAMLSKQVKRLAAAWKLLGPLAAAYEHGLLHIPLRTGSVIDKKEAEVAYPILLWKTKKAEAHGLTDTAADVISYAADAAKLALDLAEYVCDSRLGLIDSMEIDSGGTIKAGHWDNPMLWWLDPRDVSPSTIELLEGGIRIGLTPTDDDPDGDQRTAAGAT